MSEEKKYQSFTASDIDQYHKGNLSASKMHELEKAALDDPFLAEALEGYAMKGADAVADIKELKARLAKRTRDDKVIPLAGSTRSFPWLRAAAIIVFLLGGGLLVYQLGFNKKEPKNTIAKVEDKKQEAPLVIDSGKQTIARTGEDKELKNDIEKQQPGIKSQKNEETTDITTNTGSTNIKTDSASFDFATTEKPTGKLETSPVKQTDGPVVLAPMRSRELKDDKAINRNVTTVIQRDSKEPVKAIDEDLAKDKYEQAAGATEATRNKQLSNSYNEQRQRNNYFNGRVTDLNNNPLPFANVLNTSDSVGTYADARGYFNLSSPDTVLNVQVRSLGYNETNLQLRNGSANNQVYLKEDQSISPRVLDETKRNTSRRAFEPKVTIEESEPADGWSNYDIYIVNNLQVPTEIKDKEGEVEISFEVNKKGEPIHIKVEKSLCTKCDEEAIRLIKQGPKWKRKGKKGRGSVTIPFSTTH